MITQPVHLQILTYKNDPMPAPLIVMLWEAGLCWIFSGKYAGGVFPMVETNDMLELCKYTDGDFLLARVWKISFKIILKILLFWIFTQ